MSKCRILTATSLFDGHDASINIVRRVLQDLGAEVVHMGHNRSAFEVVQAALQEGCHGIAISSYQGGHMEYFSYMRELLNDAGAEYVKIFGGGGGVISLNEKHTLESRGIVQKVFHPSDGQALGLEGMVRSILDACTFELEPYAKGLGGGKHKDLEHHRALGLLVHLLEQGHNVPPELESFCQMQQKSCDILGITGSGGSGKSSLTDELILRFLNLRPGIRLGVFCVDPTKQKTGGALLGDRMRMNALGGRTFMRSMASRDSGTEIAGALPRVLEQFKVLGFDLLLVETTGTGQSGSYVLKVCDRSIYVMTAEFGAQSQLEKIDMIDFADFVVVNKADRRGAKDACHDVSKQFRRSRKLFDPNIKLPVFLTQASRFNDHGVGEVFVSLCESLEGFRKEAALLKGQKTRAGESATLPPEKQNYLANVVHGMRSYRQHVKETAEKLRAWEAVKGAAESLQDADTAVLAALEQKAQKLRAGVDDEAWHLIERYHQLRKLYADEDLVYRVRGRDIKVPLRIESLSGLSIPKVLVPDIKNAHGIYTYMALEGVPGEFPFTAGVYPLKRSEEDPTRMFAGGGTPENTNKRFHFLSKDFKAKRLSTAFDSVTLYGEDPNKRPDIFGKVGESGVSIATLEDMKRLYKGFDLCDPATSVSMTINGPAPMVLAFFMLTAIDQEVEKKRERVGRELSDQEYAEVKARCLQQVRGTVQADILKEDQGQNTCIFSIDLALKMMGDVQEYFIQHGVRNFYSVSVSGYHIAEAGANPITQLAFTLANAFTFVEYYLSRGFKVDDFAPSLSFFFSNGLDPEYTVMGRVARRLWAVVLKRMYGASARAQKLKYHIQTSGRSLHAQEMHFNDIRTTLQALLAVGDNCNSLHTNAYDEALTTPTQQSVRQAQAIQMIINKEFGLSKNEHPFQGSYFCEWLTERVERAVLEEFLSINERGGVLGAMERQYQRSKIQQESLHYEHLKHSGLFSIVGVNCFEHQTGESSEDKDKSAKEGNPVELSRASYDDKNLCLVRLEDFKKRHKAQAEQALKRLKERALGGENIFAALMDTAPVCSLGQMTHALYQVGGKYRRNI